MPKPIFHYLHSIRLFSLVFIIIFAAVGYQLLKASHAASADINGDGTVNILDLSILASNWGKTSQSFAQGDINGDGTVNILDLSLLASGWGTTTTTSCSGVNVTPSTNLQSVINANGTGTTFCFSPGTYLLTSYLTVKSNDKFISTTPRAAILTGNDTADAGIYAGGASNVTIDGLSIQHMANQWVTFPRSAIHTGTNWTIKNVDIGWNSEAGVQVNDGTIITGSYIHDNGRYGFQGGPLANVTIDSNEIARNNTAHYDPDDDAGGSKIVGSQSGATGVVETNNYVHDNFGNGIWCDFDCISGSFTGNRIENNTGKGLFFEASFGATISNNSFKTNCLNNVGLSAANCAELMLNDSQNVTIGTQTIVATTNGISLYDGNRTASSPFGTLMICNDTVSSNMKSVTTYVQTRTNPCPGTPVTYL